MRKYLPYLLLLAAIGAGIGAYQYNKPHKNINKASADFKLTATELFAEFENDETKAQEKYLDKIIQVSGRVSNISKTDQETSIITLESDHMLFGVQCELDAFSDHSTQVLPVEGEELSLKGICSGMLSDVVLVRCVIL